MVKFCCGRQLLADSETLLVLVNFVTVSHITFLARRFRASSPAALGCGCPLTAPLVTPLLRVVIYIPVLSLSRLQKIHHCL